MSLSPVDSVLLCPRNDQESLQIIKIAQALDLPLVISAQPHGARLGNEGQLIERLRAANPHANQLVIVELPGPEIEAQLTAIGYQLTIIDHHQYPGLDRMKMQSSLEQFLDVFEIDQEKLQHLGFDPVLVRGVAAIDRGFLWELKRSGYSPEQAQRARDYYRALGHELGGDFRQAEVVARQAWESQTEKDGLLIFTSPNPQIRIREALSFLIADKYAEPPTSLIIEGPEQITVQDTVQAPNLFTAFGGYTFGMNLCWGKKVSAGETMPTIEQIQSILLG